MLIFLSLLAISFTVGFLFFYLLLPIIVTKNKSKRLNRDDCSLGSNFWKEYFLGRS